MVKTPRCLALLVGHGPLSLGSLESHDHDPQKDHAENHTFAGAAKALFGIWSLARALLCPKAVKTSVLIVEPELLTEAFK